MASNGEIERQNVAIKDVVTVTSSAATRYVIQNSRALHPGGDPVDRDSGSINATLTGSLVAAALLILIGSIIVVFVYRRRKRFLRRSSRRKAPGSEPLTEPTYTVVDKSRGLHNSASPSDWIPLKLLPSPGNGICSEEGVPILLGNRGDADDDTEIFVENELYEPGIGLENHSESPIGNQYSKSPQSIEQQSTHSVDNAAMLPLPVKESADDSDESDLESSTVTSSADDGGGSEEEHEYIAPSCHQGHVQTGPEWKPYHEYDPVYVPSSTINKFVDSTNYVHGRKRLESASNPYEEIQFGASSPGPSQSMGAGPSPSSEHNAGAAPTWPLFNADDNDNFDHRPSEYDTVAVNPVYVPCPSQSRNGYTQSNPYEHMPLTDVDGTHVNNTHSLASEGTKSKSSEKDNLQNGDNRDSLLDEYITIELDNGTGDKEETDKAISESPEIEDDTGVYESYDFSPNGAN